MYLSFLAPEEARNPHTVSLRGLVNRAMAVHEPAAQETHSSILNQVTDVYSLVDENGNLSPVIDRLVQAIVSNAKDGHITISAHRFSQSITLEFQDSNNNNGYALASRLKWVEPMANEIGGTISLVGEKNRVATVSFTFPCSSAA